MNYRFRYASYDLGERDEGDRVIVKLRGAVANVLLLDHQNFSRYRAGLRFSYLGGLRRRSPVELRVPYDGHWYVAVDLGGRRGRTEASVKVFPGASPVTS
jgi:hypothetical protein